MPKQASKRKEKKESPPSASASVFFHLFPFTPFAGFFAWTFARSMVFDATGAVRPPLLHHCAPPVKPLLSSPCYQFQPDALSFRNTHTPDGPISLFRTPHRTCERIFYTERACLHCVLGVFTRTPPPRSIPSVDLATVLHPWSYTLINTAYTLHLTLYIVHHTSYTIHPESLNLSPKPYAKP